MGFLDRMFGRGKANKNNSSELAKTDKETELVDQSSIEKAIMEHGNVDLSRCQRIPLSEVSALGGSFAQLVPSIQNIITGGTVGNGSLVRVKFPAGVQGKLATLKNSGETIGGILTPGGGLAQARLTPVMLDPAAVASMAMASMMVEINRKLDRIQETQEIILNFLELDKQAEQQANLTVLTDVMNGYKYNWDNDQYRQNHHMKVLDIKQASEKNIIFYQEQIASVIKKMPAIHLDQVVKSTVAEMGKLFGNYRMALYLFAFSSFLEVMLLGNFGQEYLNQVAEKVMKYSDHYESNFSKCREMVKKFSEESLETKVLDGVGNASKALGKMLKSAPVFANGPVDEWLQDTGNKMLQGNKEKVDRTAAMFNVEDRFNSSEAFVQSILKVGKISNQTTELLFDKEAIYLAAPGAFE